MATKIKHWAYTGGLKSTMAEVAGMPFGIHVAHICYDLKPVLVLHETDAGLLYDKTEALIDFLNSNNIKIGKKDSLHKFLGDAFPKSVMVK